MRGVGARWALAATFIRPRPYHLVWSHFAWAAEPAEPSFVAGRTWPGAFIGRDGTHRPLSLLPRNKILPSVERGG